MTHRRPAGLAADLAEVIGDDGLAALVAAFGGAHIRVHVAPRPDSALARALGSRYRLLQRTYAGCQIDVPLLAAAPSQVSDATILSALSQGLSADAIAPRYRISRRRVYRIQARARRSPTR